MPDLVSGHGIIDEHRIAYAVHGIGEPVVLIHGMPSSSRIWRNIAPKLVDAGPPVEAKLSSRRLRTYRQPHGRDRRWR